MLAVPTEIRVRYAEFLTGRGVAQKYVNKCQKWLRYYLDFCKKYHYEKTTSQGLEAFLLKLTEKRQSVESKQEAKKAVLLYHDFLNPTESAVHCSKAQGKDKRVPVVHKTHFKDSNGAVLP